MSSMPDISSPWQNVNLDKTRIHYNSHYNPYKYFYGKKFSDRTSVPQYCHYKYIYSKSSSDKSVPATFTASYRLSSAAKCAFRISPVYADDGRAIAHDGKGAEANSSPSSWSVSHLWGKLTGKSDREVDTTPEKANIAVEETIERLEQVADLSPSSELDDDAPKRFVSDNEVLDFIDKETGQDRLRRMYRVK